MVYVSRTVLSLVSVKMANFGIFADLDLCTGRKEECPQLFHKLVGWS